MMRGYAARSGKPGDEIVAFMAAETWFDAAEALDAGLATRMAEPVRIAASFDIGRFRNAPPDLVEAVESVDAENAATATDIVADGNDVDPASDPVPHTQLANGGAPAADPAPPPETKDPDSTVAAANTAPDVTAIRAEAIAHARAVIDLCRLAGQPQMAGRFLEEEASLDAVRASLLDARADAAPQITPHHPQPGPNPTTRPWGDVIARTFKLKG
jgi:hypothetical protein